jgi:hypothetical protein
MLLVALAVAVAAAFQAPVRDAVPAQTPAAGRSGEVVRRHLEHINRGEWRQAADYFAEDVQHHRGNWPGGTEAIVKGKQVLAGNLEDIFRAFPD